VQRRHCLWPAQVRLAARAMVGAQREVLDLRVRQARMRGMLRELTAQAQLKAPRQQPLARQRAQRAWAGQRALHKLTQPSVPAPERQEARPEG